MKFTNANNFLFLFILCFNVLFYIRILSYFEKPKSILYDERFDNNFKKIKLDYKNKKYNIFQICINFL